MTIKEIENIEMVELVLNRTKARLNKVRDDYTVAKAYHADADYEKMRTEIDTLKTKIECLETFLELA